MVTQLWNGMIFRDDKVIYLLADLPLLVLRTTIIPFQQEQEFFFFKQGMTLESIQPQLSLVFPTLSHLILTAHCSLLTRHAKVEGPSTDWWLLPFARRKTEGPLAIRVSVRGEVSVVI